MKRKIHSIKKKFIGQSITLIQQEVSFGKDKRMEFEIVDRQPIALIIPILNELEIIIIHQYRAAVDSYIWEFPAGKKIDGESIQQTAIRELEEETGFKTTQLTLIGEFYTAPHFTNEKVIVFIATQLEESFPKFQEHEFIKVHILEYNSIKDLFNKAIIKDCKSLVALQLLGEKVNKI